MELIDFGKSQAKNKRFRAIFMKDGRKITTNFGQKKDDGSFPITFLDGATEEKRELYLKRHKKDLETKDPTRAGFLSFYVIWGKSRSVEKNLKKYLKDFNIKDRRK
jgi:hypothetical protein